MVRKLAVAVVALAFPSLALAATFGLGGGSLGAGAAPVEACDDAFVVTYATTGGNVTAVTVGDVADPGCEGGELSLTLVDASGSGIAAGGPVAVPFDGDALPNDVAVPVSPQPAAESVAGVRIAIVGP